jgi:hypothetical protein
MNKPDKRPLRLRPESIRSLSARALASVAGGTASAATACATCACVGSDACPQPSNACKSTFCHSLAQ